MLELYHAEPRANSMKPLICLKEKGLDFVSHYVDLLRFEQHEPWFVKINANGQVPVLVHDGAAITESTVINEYLDEVFPEVPLRPADPLARARMRVWTKYVDEYFCPALSMIGWHIMVRRIAAAVPKHEFEKLLARIPLAEQRIKWATVAGDSFPEEQLADSRRRCGIAIGRMEETLKSGPWLAGDAYSLADVDIYSMVDSIPRLMPEHMNEAKTPRVMDWLARMNARPAVQAARAMPDKTPETLRQFGVEL
ncbi:MAG: glutathione S-transferase family protein [Alphaproteobacteria bacterium]|nr:glutathione S-transferase family protein [Alphaproteobacteria bacterium]MBU6472285.1 glutathione S-transferase family protein [Alphaproteobacteria bacterium]MDE2014001.1 glutathione S-transferase family protein [Alphaproteobacteria bacterium]MDE2072618.1 glutathione S-transferase family protein [Alphaproteobacteria bacterium]MDE2351891.1 glutathione S-transferase family protein [Alphaproteobacteria bacterium]